MEIICMENCENTLDDLMQNELTNLEWFSMLMQVIMILITYQKAFHFTHNDLHSNNVMYIPTPKKYLFYRYNQTYYRVPTFGRIFKIIDFGRSIFTFQTKLFCSDSFEAGNDAGGQYNTEPFFNPEKPRIDPNPSFDLCRFACSIVDTIIPFHEMMQGKESLTDPLKLLIYDWCCDDRGQNLMYKRNGDDRYPEFKLYKMIARNPHHQIPSKQLQRDIFQQFKVAKKLVTKNIDLDIDKIPVFI